MSKFYEKETKHEVITQGTPRFENMPKEVFNVFCTSLLAVIEDYYKDYEYKRKKTSQQEAQTLFSLSHKKVTKNF